MNAAEEMVVGAARQAAERGDATALEASLLIIVDRQQATIQRVRIEHRSDMAGIPWCYACDASWPCDTIRALDGDA